MPKIKLQNLQKAINTGKYAVDVGKEVLPVLQPLIEQYAPKVVEQVRDAANTAAKNSKNAKVSFLNNMQLKKELKEQKKTNEENRKKAVSSSLPPVSAKEFFKNFEANMSDSSELDSGYMAFTGCYAIITMKSKGEKDLSAYKDVFVGCGSSVGLAVYSQLRGLGNIDVYADFKFKEPMWVLSYPCNEDEIGPEFAELLQNLNAADSYNKWDLQSLVSTED
jgi:hypothetical protein